LERLGVEETLQPALDFAQRRHAGDEGYVLDVPFNVGVDEQLAQLMQYFGRMRYAPSDSFLRTFVPESEEFPLSRAAAIWALGHLLEGKPDPQLAQQLIGRVQDVGPPVPEFEVVRRFSAITLGRMGAQQSVATLRFFRDAETLLSEVGYACAWALKQLTGENYEEPKPPLRTYTNFFLEPLPDKRIRDKASP